jgi:glycosyltransferase involved in cell wall biosynthesis
MRPLVTVAIPTHQRAMTLRRAVESVVAQDYEPIELIISDNASTDGTRLVCEEYAARHPWIRYVRLDANIGAIANFESLRRRSNGEFFLFLADDDWIDPGLVTACVDALQADPASALVAGRALYHGLGEVKADLHPTNLLAEDSRARVLDYCRTVRGNSVFYGIAPVAVHRNVAPLRNVMGADFLQVLSLAFLGRVRTLEEAGLHRSVDGMAVSLANVAAGLGLSRWQAFAPQVAIVYWVFRDIAFDSPVYAGLGRFARLRLATRAASILFVRFVPGAIVKFARLQGAAVTRRWRTAALDAPIP